MSQRAKPILRLGITIALLILSVAIFINRQTISDQISVWQYAPTQEISEISSRSSLNERGKFLFYAAHPKIQNRDEFNSSCSQHTEKSVVLGCFDGRNIFIYDINDPRLDGIKEVTAAHEMLHVAYDRLSEQEKSDIHRLIDETLSTSDTSTIDKKIALYDQTEPSQRYNELHSMLGTELLALPEELALYYDKYFINRVSLVELAQRYETVFNELESRQRAIVDELNTLAEDITNGSSDYTQRFDSLQRDIIAFNARAEEGFFTSQSAFDAERSALIARQSELNTLRIVLNNKITYYKNLAIELDALNLTAQGLQKSIDSRALPEVPSI